VATATGQGTSDVLKAGATGALTSGLFSAPVVDKVAKTLGVGNDAAKAVMVGTKAAAEVGDVSDVVSETLLSYGASNLADHLPSNLLDYPGGRITGDDAAGAIIAGIKDGPAAAVGDLVAGELVQPFLFDLQAAGWSEDHFEEAVSKAGADGFSEGDLIAGLKAFGNSYILDNKADSPHLASVGIEMPKWLKDRASALDIDLPSWGGSESIKLGNIDLSEIKLPKIDLPNIDVPNIDMPSPGISESVDVNLPDFNLEGEGLFGSIDMPSPGISESVDIPSPGISESITPPEIPDITPPELSFGGYTPRNPLPDTDFNIPNINLPDLPESGGSEDTDINITPVAAAEQQRRDLFDYTTITPSLTAVLGPYLNQLTGEFV
jgi:hypothetical protein